MSLSWFASLVPLPVVIDKPGPYLTRSGEAVEITAVGAANAFSCFGYYPNKVASDKWHRSGRLYFGTESDNDIVRALDKSGK